MIRSLAVILLPILVITVLLTRNLDDHPVTVVDWQPVLAVARSQAPYPVLAPVNLPPDWRATTVRWVKVGDPYLNGEPAVRNTWQLGFLAPDDIFIGLNQGDRRSEEFIKDQTREGVADGESTVAGQKWQRLVTEDDRTRSLVLTTPQVTSIVVGDTSYQALESYAGTLSSR
jgi:hypothetical protein